MSFVVDYILLKKLERYARRQVEKSITPTGLAVSWSLIHLTLFINYSSYSFNIDNADTPSWIRKTLGKVELRGCTTVSLDGSPPRPMPDHKED